MPEENKKIIKDSKKIKLIVNPKNLEIIEFSESARRLFLAAGKSKKKIFLSDLIPLEKSSNGLRNLLKLKDQKSVKINSLSFKKNSNNTGKLSLKAESIKIGQKKLIECTFNKIKTESKKTNRSKNNRLELNRLSEVEELKRTNKKLRTIFQNNPLMIFIVDKKGIITEVNSLGAKELGYEINELLNQPVTKVFLKQDWRIIKNQINKCIKNPGKLFNWEIRKIRKNGSVIWVKENACVIESNEKNPEVLIVCDDITKIKQAEKSLKESRDRIRQIVEASPYGVHVYYLEENGDLIFTGYNSAANKILGIDHELLINKKIEDAFPNLTQTDIPEIYKRIAKSGNYIENKIVDYEDIRVQGAFDVSAIQIEEGKIAAFFSDITEKRKAFDELEKSELKFKSLFEFANDAIFLMDSDIFKDCNKKTLEMFECKEEDIVGKSPYEFSPEKQPDGRFSKEKALEKIKLTLSGRPQRFEWKHKKFNGELFDAEVSLNRLLLGNNVLLQAIVRDITERRKTEEALKESEERFRSLIDNMIEAALIVNWDGKIIFANNSAATLVGLKNPQQGVGKKVFEFLHPDFVDKVSDAIIRIKENPMPLIDEYKIKTISGTELWVESLGREIIFLRKNYILVTLRDITGRKNAETQLREAKEKAEEMSRIKSSFLMNISHELRTPLVGILGFAELLKEKLKTKQNLEMADRILISANRLMETLNLLLDLSRIEARKVDINLQPYRISELVESQTILFEAVAERKNLFLNTSISDHNSLSLVDEQVFRQIINNLINNALKYTYTGGVTVIVDSVKKDENSYVQVKVKDTGIGIPAESLSLIFQEFRQVSEGFNRHFEGTGLGLTITKNFVELMNGQILVESKVGAGSTFTILFPLLENYQQLKEQKVTEVISSSVDDKKIILDFKPKVLIVENDDASIDIIRLFLKDLCIVEFTDSGEKAFKLANEKKYDMILMDINLGKGMSGTEATKEIRKIENYKDIPIVAITGFAMRGDKEEFIKAGCTHYLSKPFSRGKIIKLIKQVFAEERA